MRGNINSYKVLKMLGKGQFGIVYKCQKGNKNYAIKVFSSEYVFEEFNLHGDDNRIVREISALKNIDSPYVVKYCDQGSFYENDTLYFYVVMDYIEGTNLNDFIKANDLSLENIIEIFKQIILGLKAIHNSNIIHRDLKPQNIYITNNGNVKILDFGLSKLIDYTSITKTGDQLGSPLYMSPEQIKDSKNVDYRSDYYAAGVILYALIAGVSPYGQITSLPELYAKILSHDIKPIRIYNPSLPNSIENLIDALLAEENYKRPNSADAILMSLSSESKVTKELKINPSFYLRLLDEKTVLEDFYKDGYSIEHVVFPINLQNRQKGLLNLIKKENVDAIIDPATMRLAYDSYTETRGLIELPYAPDDLRKLEIEDLLSLQNQQSYVKKVVDEQLKHTSNSIVAPFHVSNNSNLIKIKNDIKDNWFTIDVKLLKVTREYLNSLNYTGKLIAGFCVKTEILTSKNERDYFLNVISALDCDAYIIYVDCIDYNSNASQLYNYSTALLELQNRTQRPVIAGRIGSFGLVLLAFGLYAFESGASRFESFYEDLYKSTSDPYNMYVKYYMPELFNNISVERKNPAKIIQLLQTDTGKNIQCTCPYCSGKTTQAMIEGPTTKKHFIFRRNKEIQDLRNIANLQDRADYIEKRIDAAIDNYKHLKPIFKDDDYRFLKIWKDVIALLKRDMKYDT